MRFTAARLCGALALLLATTLSASAAAARHNVVLFVADGLRYVSVTSKTAPTMARIRREGVDFTNSHAVYPTVTTVNGASIATGHWPGDTGNFGNQLYTGFASPEAGGAKTPFVENDAILGEMNAHFGGNYLNEESLLAAARKAGFATAAIGKKGPTAIQDVTARDGKTTIVIDDSVGTATGLPLPPDLAAAIQRAGLANTAPRTSVPNVAQQKYLMAITTRFVLPRLVHSGKPFVLVFWSRDPDASQHGTRDSIGKLRPGINGPSATAGIRNADHNLATLLAALKAGGLDKTTDVFVTADHGFSTIYKGSKTSAAAGKNGGEVPSGFVAVDLAAGLSLPLFDPNLQKPVDYAHGAHPAYGNGYIGRDPNHPDVVVAANGGSDHIYLPGPDAKMRVRDVVRILLKQDYVSGLFVNDALGDVPGTLPMSAVNLRGTARTPQPAVIVNFRSFAIPGCKPLLMCAAELADTSLKTGQGMHGTFSRADTRNFMAAIGPSFRTRYRDPSPVANADITPTLAQILSLKIAPIGGLTGRVASEALKGGKAVPFRRRQMVSPPAGNGLTTVLDYQEAKGVHYLDAAGFPGRTVGLGVP